MWNLFSIIEVTGKNALALAFYRLVSGDQSNSVRAMRKIFALTSVSVWQYHSLVSFFFSKSGLVLPFWYRIYREVGAAEGHLTYENLRHFAESFFFQNERKKKQAGNQPSQI